MNMSFSTSFGSGIHSPNSPFFLASNVSFVNYHVPSTVCISPCAFCKPFDGGWEGRSERLSFYNSTRKISWDWEHEYILRDLDGTLGGKVGTALAWSNLYPKSSCVNLTEFNYDYPGTFCDSSVRIVRMALNQATPLTLKGIDLIVSNQYGSSAVPWREKRSLPQGYMAGLVQGLEHTYRWDLTPDKDVDYSSYYSFFAGLRARE
jgi:hypothetical protein